MLSLVFMQFAFTALPSLEWFFVRLSIVVADILFVAFAWANKGVRFCEQWRTDASTNSIDGGVGDAVENNVPMAEALCTSCSPNTVGDNGVFGGESTIDGTNLSPNWSNKWRNWLDVFACRILINVSLRMSPDWYLWHNVWRPRCGIALTCLQFGKKKRKLTQANKSSWLNGSFFNKLKLVLLQCVWF